MANRRVTIARIADPKAEGGAGGAARKVDAPSLSDIRIVFGVGKGPDAAPDEKGFRAVYTVSIPVFSLGGLDSDGVYEFDAVMLLRTLRDRARRRQWAVRLELEFVQTADSIAQADVIVESPYDEQGGATISIVGRSGSGAATPGGGRSITVASGLALDEAAVGRLGGTFNVRVGEPGSGVHSDPRPIRLALGQFEFEG